MRATVPVRIEGAMLFYSNLPDLAAGEVNYNAGTTYAIDAKVVDPSDHRMYQSLQPGNVGKALPVYPATKNDWWFGIGSTNQRAMFDLDRNTQTIGADLVGPGVGSAISVIFQPGVRCNTFAALDMVADDIYVNVYRPDQLPITSSSIPVYSYAENLVVREVLDQYMYAYKDFDTRPAVVRFDAPPFTNAVFQIIITRNTSGVRCGSIVTGTYAYIGSTQYEAESELLNFSTFTRDVYGNASLVRRRTVPKTSQTLTLDKRYVNNVRGVREVLNSIPALYTGLDDSTDGYFDLFAMLGVYTKWSINAKQPETAFINIDVEGL